jgi:hypothetical protein
LVEILDFVSDDKPTTAIHSNDDLLNAIANWLWHSKDHHWNELQLAMG